MKIPGSLIIFLVSVSFVWLQLEGCDDPTITCYYSDGISKVIAPGYYGSPSEAGISGVGCKFKDAQCEPIPVNSATKQKLVQFCKKERLDSSIGVDSIVVSCPSLLGTTWTVEKTIKI